MGNGICQSASQRGKEYAWCNRQIDLKYTLVEQVRYKLFIYIELTEAEKAWKSYVDRCAR